MFFAWQEKQALIHSDAVAMIQEFGVAAYTEALEGNWPFTFITSLEQMRRAAVIRRLIDMPSRSGAHLRFRLANSTPALSSGRKIVQALTLRLDLRIELDGAVRDGDRLFVQTQLVENSAQFEMRANVIGRQLQNEPLDGPSLRLALDRQQIAEKVDKLRIQRMELHRAAGESGRLLVSAQIVQRAA